MIVGQTLQGIKLANLGQYLDRRNFDLQRPYQLSSRAIQNSLAARHPSGLSRSRVW